MAVEERQPRPEGELATGTLAEIYAEQGLYERALAIYQRIALRAPHDEAIGERIAALTERIERVREGEEIREGEESRESAESEASPVTVTASAPSAGPASTEASPDEAFQVWLDSR